MNLGVERILVI